LNDVTITFLPAEQSVSVPAGTLISAAASLLELEIAQPCGGQGRCGRCTVHVKEGSVHRRSTLRLSAAAVEEGYALACQTTVQSDAQITIPTQETIQRHMESDKSAGQIKLPFAYKPATMQTIRQVQLTLSPPSLADNRDDFSRLKTALSAQGMTYLTIPLSLLREMSGLLRAADWNVWVVLDVDPAKPEHVELLDIRPDRQSLYGLAIDIGTTTVTAYLADLESGEILGNAAEYNSQIARGEDVISRIMYASKGNGLEEMGERLHHTIEILLTRLQERTAVTPAEILKVAIAGNTTMMHLFLQLPPESIRMEPYIPTLNEPARYRASELGLGINPLAHVDCLPGVAAYVGADISAGVLAAGLLDIKELTLFIDIGTNGEIVLGNEDWLVTCACSAGPAFEGSGVLHGMRATQGAIEDVWIDARTREPVIRIIGDQAARGICGSGLIALIAEMFITGIIDRSGNIKLDLESPRIRTGDHGPEYVVAFADQTANDKDIVITKVDIENLIRAKAAIYAGFNVLASSVGVDLSDVSSFLIGGTFGKYINIEKAIQIGLLPDIPWDRFQFLGNTSALGTAMAFLSHPARQSIQDIAAKMTYIELSANNDFFDAFTAALFLPHTEAQRFPNVISLLSQNEK